jgi:hypothetical protein
MLPPQEWDAGYYIMEDGFWIRMIIIFENLVKKGLTNRKTPL